MGLPKIVQMDCGSWVQAIDIPHGKASPGVLIIDIDDSSWAQAIIYIPYGKASPEVLVIDADFC